MEIKDNNVKNSSCTSKVFKVLSIVKEVIKVFCVDCNKSMISTVISRVTTKRSRLSERIKNKTQEIYLK